MKFFRQAAIYAALLAVLYLIPFIAIWDYLDKRVNRKPEKYWEIVGKAYGYWGMTMAMAVNTHADL